MRKIHQYLKWVKNVENLRARFSKDVLDIDYSQMLRKPQKVVKKMCKFLDLKYTADYIRSCTKKIFRNETRTRSKVFWPEEIKGYLIGEMKTIAPYREFMFDG